MYLIKKVTDKTSLVREAVSQKPFGPAFNASDAEQAESMEVWGTSCNDTGNDYCEFRLIKDNKVFKTSQIAGY